MDNARTLHIITQIKAGDQALFAELIDNYKDMVYTLCLRMTHSKEDAEEIAQDAFVKAFQAIKSFKGKSKFSTWLYQITYHTTLNFLRKKKVVTTAITANHQPTSDNNTFEELQQEDRITFIQNALQELPAIDSAIVSLFYLEEYSIAEIATITKLSQSNVKVKLHRSKKKLLSVLQINLKNELNSLV